MFWRNVLSPPSERLAFWPRRCRKHIPSKPDYMVLHSRGQYSKIQNFCWKFSGRHNLGNVITDGRIIEKWPLEDQGLNVQTWASSGWDYISSFCWYGTEPLFSLTAETFLTIWIISCISAFHGISQISNANSTVSPTNQNYHFNW